MSTPNPHRSYDTVVIGAGQAGPGLAASCAHRGERVALVEAVHFGGTCLNSGCRPTKALRASARAAHIARSSQALGVRITSVEVDFAAVMARKDALIDAWRDGYEASWAARTDLDYIRGHARFMPSIADNTASPARRFTIKVEATDAPDAPDEVLAADRIIVNVGARSILPAIDGIETVDVLDHNSVLHLRELPEHLIVLGGSYIGLELGQIFRRFGSRVTVIEKSARIVSREDPDISAALHDSLAREDIDIRTSATVVRMRRRQAVSKVEVVSGVEVELDDSSRIVGSHVLAAAGRVPNSDRLDTQNIGLTLDSRGYIVTDAHFLTNVPGVYAVGDVNGRGAFTHTSYQDYEILADHLGGGPRSVDGRVMTYALFTDPPLGRCGMSETEARASGRPIKIATFPMTKLTRAALDGETAGLIKIIIDATTDEMLGAACLGLEGDEIIQVISALMHVGAPASALSTWLPVHPTVAEFFPTIVASARRAS
jgi:pyruvate/2-oxoglutarate dehydrogenase complex dihydrolipoamide dehydrogenase (E3) component